MQHTPTAQVGFVASTSVADAFSSSIGVSRLSQLQPSATWSPARAPCAVAKVYCFSFFTTAFSLSPTLTVSASALVKPSTSIRIEVIAGFSCTKR